MAKQNKAIKQLLKDHNSNHYNTDGVFVQVVDKDKSLMFNYLKAGRKFVLFNKCRVFNLENN